MIKNYMESLLLNLRILQSFSAKYRFHYSPSLYIFINNYPLQKHFLNYTKTITINRESYDFSLTYNLMLDHQLALIHFLNGMNGLKMEQLSCFQN